MEKEIFIAKNNEAAEQPAQVYPILNNIEEPSEYAAVQADSFESEPQEEPFKVAAEETIAEPGAAEAEEITAQKCAEGTDAEEITARECAEETDAEEITVRECAEKTEAKENKPENKGITLLLAAACFVIAVLTGFLLSSSAIVLPGSRTGVMSRNGADEFAAFVSDLAVYAVGEAAELPKYYVLPLSDDPAPAADRANIRWEVGRPLDYPTDIDVHCYEDETISVRCWKEVCGYTYVAFSEIKIQHPTQFRRAFAGGSYDSGQRYYPQVIAQTNNAVIAMSADYCSYRDEGLIIHQRKLYRDNTNENLDILLYDSKGDLHIMPHKEVESSNILEEKDIIYTFAFGPALVVDGVLQEREHIDKYVLGFPAGREPRAAIGQLGEMHYLLCVVEGRTERLAGSDNEYDQSGLLVREVADLMYSKGCYNAYAMDGGQTATMVFMGDLVNNVAYGGQRLVSDILYFATACGEDK